MQAINHPLDIKTPPKNCLHFHTSCSIVKGMGLAIYQCDTRGFTANVDQAVV